MAAGWTEDLRGLGGYRMPATQHDAWVWMTGRQRSTTPARCSLRWPGWPGFVDGTGNPSLLTAAGAPDGSRDGLTDFLTPLSGACCTCPSVDALARFAPAEEG